MLALPFLAALAAVSAPAHALEDDFDFDLEGYYRVRGHVNPGLYLDQVEAGKYMEQRLRLQPELNFQDRAKFIMMADVIDDVVWGDNASLAATSLFAGDPSFNGIDGDSTSTFNVKRAWMEFQIPVGLFKIGRQESHWGMGLLANHGNGFDDTFGENHDGATFDRVVFATKPLAIVGAATGKDKLGDIPLFFAVGVDRLVEDPLFKYYGYECESGLTEGVDDDYDSRCDSDGDGYSDLSHDITDETRTPDQRGADWYVDNDDDVYEALFVLIYRGEGLDVGGSAMDLTVGAYLINRQQAETGSKVIISDAYLKFLWKGIYAEGEVLHIGGPTSAIALPGSYDPTGTLANPLYKEADIWGYVGRVGYKQETWSAIFETGYASGDDDVADENFTGRPLAPDYNVGLIIYDQVMAHVTAATWSSAADSLWSNGGVYNSRYVFPYAQYRPLDNWEITGAFLTVWPDKPDGSRILCATGDDVNCSLYEATASTIGWEADLGIHHRFHNHINLAVEGAYAQITDRIPLRNTGLNPDGKFFTFQTRVAYEF